LWRFRVPLLESSPYFSKDYLEKPIIDDKEQPCTLAQLAAKNNHYPILLKLQERGVSLDSIVPIINEETVEKCLKKLEAEHFYKEHLSNKKEFTQHELSYRGKGFESLINDIDQKVNLLNWTKKRHWGDILLQTFLSCMKAFTPSRTSYSLHKYR